MGLISTGIPKKCTIQIALVLLLIFFLISSNEIFPVFISQSAKTALAPVYSTACAVAI